MRKSIASVLITLILVFSLAACGGKPSSDTVPPWTSTAAQETDPTQTEAMTEAPMEAPGWVVTGAEDYALLLREPDEGATVLARLYEGVAVQILYLKGAWCAVSYGDLIGYVKNVNISFTKPTEPETESPAETASPTEAPTEPPTEAPTEPPTQAEQIRQGMKWEGYPCVAGDTGEGTDWLGYVSASSANLRSEPDKTNDKNVIAILKRGTPFRVLSCDGYWYYIEYAGGEGCISHKMVTICSTPDSDRYLILGGRVTADACKLRSSPYTTDDSNVVATLHKGNVVYLDAEDGVWAHVYLDNGLSGFVSLKMITTGPLCSLERILA